jgi:hypothetical protein
MGFRQDRSTADSIFIIRQHFLKMSRVQYCDVLPKNPAYSEARC